MPHNHNSASVSGMAEQKQLPEPEKKPTEKSIEKPKLRPVLIGTDEERQAKMNSFIKDFGHFTKKLNEGLSQEDCWKDEQVVALFHEYLDLQVSEQIWAKDMELAMLRAKVQEGIPASPPQIKALKRFRDGYSKVPEMKVELQKALEKVGLKSLTDEDMKSLTIDQAHALMDILVPFRAKYGWGESPPEGFKTADKYRGNGPEYEGEEHDDH